MSKQLQQEQYDDWWENVGIIQVPSDEDTFKQFVKRVAFEAWKDGHDTCRMEYVQTMEADIAANTEKMKALE